MLERACVCSQQYLSLNPGTVTKSHGLAVLQSFKENSTFSTRVPLDSRMPLCALPGSAPKNCCGLNRFQAVCQWNSCIIKGPSGGDSHTRRALGGSSRVTSRRGLPAAGPPSRLRQEARDRPGSRAGASSRGRSPGARPSSRFPHRLPVAGWRTPPAASLRSSPVTPAGWERRKLNEDGGAARGEGLGGCSDPDLSAHDSPPLPALRRGPALWDSSPCHQVPSHARSPLSLSISN